MESAACQHDSFMAVARVNRLESGHRVCDLVLKCADCGLLFRWGDAKVQRDGLRLRVPVSASEKYDR